MIFICQFVFFLSDQILTKTGTHHVAAFTESELLEWMDSIQSIAFRDDSSRRTIEEENELYCSSGDGLFNVRLVPSPASIRCKLDPGSYILLMTDSEIQLRHCEDNHRLLYNWPYHYIRNYGCKEGKFFFEAGRKCKSGEGRFPFEHAQQQEIFRLIYTKMKNMKKLMSNSVESVSSSASNPFESQLHAALNMEARSRSPLPHSTTALNLIDIEISQMSLQHQPVQSTLIKQFNSLSLSENLRSPSFELGGDEHETRMKPAKPPRKSIRKKPEEEDKSKRYDEVEVRQNAWVTMGQDNPPHSERRYVDSEEICTGLSHQPKYETPDAFDGHAVKKMPAKIIHSTATSYENYDKLQHFGSTKSSKVNSGYRMISTLSGRPKETPTSPTSYDDDDYDIVENVMQTARMADDSHRGYGMIRKKSESALPSPRGIILRNPISNININSSSSSSSNREPAEGPPHKVFNEIEYAIVSKRLVDHPQYFSTVITLNYYYYYYYYLILYTIPIIIAGCLKENIYFLTYIFIYSKIIFIIN